MNLAVAILLTWADAINPPGATYNVYRAPGACSESSRFEKLTPVPLAAKTHQDAPGPGNWCYRVTAFVGAIESAPSSPVTALVQPAAPTGLTVAPAPVASSPP